MRRTLLMLTFVLLIGSFLNAVEFRAEKGLFGLTISPNPFEFQTTITVYVSTPTPMFVAIYNDHKDLVKTIFSGEASSGYHQFGWNGSNNEGGFVSSGKYTCEVTDFQKFTSVKKIIILK